MRGCVRVTGRGVEDVLEGCWRLKLFDVSQCRNLLGWLEENEHGDSDGDGVGLGKGRGVLVVETGSGSGHGMKNGGNRGENGGSRYDDDDDIWKRRNGSVGSISSVGSENGVNGIQRKSSGYNKNRLNGGRVLGR